VSSLEDKIGLIFVMVSLCLFLQLLLVFGVIGGLLQAKAKKQKEYGDFRTLWYQNKLADLVAAARATLATEPNHSGALFYGGKALRRSGDLAEAKDWLERAIVSEPMFKQLAQAELKEMEGTGGC